MLSFVRSNEAWCMRCVIISRAHVCIICVLPVRQTGTWDPLLQCLYLDKCLFETKKHCFVFVKYKETVVVQSLSHVQLFVTPWTAARQASLYFTVSWNLLKLMSIKLGCRPTISSSVIPFSSCLQSSGSFAMSRLCIRWPKYWSFSSEKL